MKHLDIGCGRTPKNPYDADELYGVDVYPEVVDLGPNYKHCNMAMERLPFEDNFFDSVSAFDVLEHIPRQALDFANGVVRQPFIDLMDEIHRVLKANGMFYAYTPAFPSKEAFQDPTHVNFITIDTHTYFCGKDGYAKNYGFKGEFEAVEVEWFYATYARKAGRDWKTRLKNWHKKHIRGGLNLRGVNVGNIVWQLRAVKKP
jgi:SAM-dependent methyltransferase